MAAQTAKEEVYRLLRELPSSDAKDVIRKFGYKIVPARTSFIRGTVEEERREIRVASPPKGDLYIRILKSVAFSDESGAQSGPDMVIATQSDAQDHEDIAVIEIKHGESPAETDLDEVISLDLSSLEADELSILVQDLVKVRLGAARASEFGTLLTAFLRSSDQVEMLAGDAPNVMDHLDDEMRRIAVLSTARRAVLDLDMLESTAVAEALGRSGTNAREAASILRRKGGLLGVKVHNRYLFPAFQMDFEAQELRRSVAEVNRILHAIDDPWGVASWWISANPRLHGTAPRDILGTPEEEKLLRLAHAESAE